MKNNHLLIAGLLLSVAFVACSKKEEPVEEPTPLPPQEEVEEYSYIFALSSPGDDSQTAAAQGVKTTFDTRHVKWEVGDMVGSYSSKSSVASGNVNKSTGVTIDGSGNPHVTVRSNVALSAGNIVYAYYPYNNRNNSHESSAVTLEIPRNQVSGTADAMPMVALPFTLTGTVPKYTDTEVGTLEFMNLGSVIKLNIYSSNSTYQGETIENVTFQAGAACAGSFTYNLTTANVDEPATISGYSERDVVVTGRATVGTSTEDGGVFYIIVAPGTYSGTFKIRTNRADYTYVSGTPRTYARAAQKPLNINLGSANWTEFTSFDNSIDSPREFAAFLAGTSSGDTGSYTITCDLDMTGYTITSASGFGGTLNGQDHVISNLTSSVPLFAENGGTIKNLILDGTCSFSPSSNVFGALVTEDKGGVYESVKTAATLIYTPTDNVTTSTMIGGLVGYTNVSGGATFTSCSNSGIVKLEAPDYYHVSLAMGGLVGYAQKVTFTSCVNSGPVTVNAWYGDPSVDTGIVDLIGIGGLVGMIYSGTSSSSITTCDNKAQGVITLNHTDIYQLEAGDDAYSVTVGGICGYGTVNMNKAYNFAPINVSCKAANGNPQKLKRYILKCGGVIGVVGSNSGLESCKNEGAITVDYDGSYRGDSGLVNCAAVGGIYGSVGYRNSSQINYCDSKAAISVSGAGTVCVGGIGGINGMQIRDRFFGEKASITINVAESYVGGVWGQVSQAKNADILYAQAKGCKVEANITTTSSNATLGGLLGLWNAGHMSQNVYFISFSDNTSSYSGTISAPSATKVGVLVGDTGTGTKTFGKSGDNIIASGSIQRSGISLTTITNDNIGTYWYGVKGGTNNIFVEVPEP